MSDDELLLAMAEAVLAAYADAGTMFFENYNQSCHVHHVVVNEINTFIFDGTTDLLEWDQDLNDSDMTDSNIPEAGEVHSWSMLNIRNAAPVVSAKMADLGWPPCYLAGHSKGAREATLMHAWLKTLGHAPLQTFLFEPPRAGGNRLAAYLADDVIVATQTFNADGPDVVTLLPSGSGWADVRSHMIRLMVPDSMSVADKHRMAAVVIAIRQRLPLTECNS